MPPKKSSSGQPSKKTVEKKKDKLIEDKTFGLKNKKGAKTQNYIKTVTSQVKHGNQKAKDQLDQLDKKTKKRLEQEEINMLFKPVTAQQKVAKGVDPKSVVCAFFKQGTCTKGDKCKFSHDLAVERKSGRKNLYEDTREDELANDTMENWDEEKLKIVVEQKHKEENAQKPKTDKVCKFFIQAIEECKYGWFWICPNGGDKCMYRHALPPGFVLKSQKKKQDEEQPDQRITIEELIEEERAKIGLQQTKITLETFLEWKTKKIAEKTAQMELTMNKKKSDFKMGKSLGITGRELFAFNPDMVGDDDDEAADDTQYRRESDDDEQNDLEVKDVCLEYLKAEEVDGTGTVSSTTKRDGETSTVTTDSLPGTRLQDNTQEDEDGKLDQAAALPPEDDANPTPDMVNGIPVDENLFVEDVEVDEELFGQELEEELDDLDLED